MNSELEQKLYRDYPKIFGQKDNDMSVTSMCWGIDTDDGWYTLIDKLCEVIQNHIDWNNCEGKYEYSKAFTPEKERIEQVEATQVKSKFGGLRFYVQGGNQFTDGAISIAESISLTTCECCGNLGKSRDTGWVYTFCDACHDSYMAKKNAVVTVK